MEEKKKLFIFRPIVIITILLILQIIIVVLLFTKLRQYFQFTASTWIIITFLVTIYLINTEDPIDYKLAWIIPIVGLPVFGITLYLFLQALPGTKQINSYLKDELEKSSHHMSQNPDTLKKLHDADNRKASLANYLYRNGNFPIYENTAVEYYSLGEDVFPDMLRDLKAAKKFIFMEYFIINEGYMLNSILDILGEKAKEGVEIFFMYDGSNAYSISPSLRKRIISLGIQVKEFAPVLPILSTYHNYRDHRKITVIDNEIAYTGGINLSDEYINRVVKFGHWKDTSIRLEGEAVKTMTVLFLQLWNLGKRNDVAYSDYLVDTRSVPQSEDCLLIPYGDSPNDGENIGENVYIDLLNQAAKYVYVMTPYLILDELLLNALKITAKRGVEVIILMPHIADKDVPLMIARSYYLNLISAGVKIYEYEPGFIHAKSFVVDDIWSVVGSINLDFRSLHLHYENAVLIYSEKLAFKIKKDFLSSVSLSIEMTREKYLKIPLLNRFLGRILRLFGPLM